MKRWLFSLFSLFAVAPILNAGTALQAVQVLPAFYRDNVYRVSADNGTPNPPQWFFTVRSNSGGGGLHSVTVQDQEIISDKRSLDIRTLVTDPSPIDFARVRIDSDAAWNVAGQFCQQKGRKLGSASFVLQQKGVTSAPLWSVWCYDAAGNYIGLVTLLATSGDVISSE
ncbi:MAG: hypothetical protein SFU53_05300 [Terrimicrobiaceae bacterium]|nr:hypothetical protein [Terrimicrobiaceae bacterium]